MGRASASLWRKPLLMSQLRLLRPMMQFFVKLKFDLLHFPVEILNKFLQFV